MISDSGVDGSISIRDGRKRERKHFSFDSTALQVRTSVFTRVPSDRDKTRRGVA